MPALQTLLTPQVLTKVITRIASTSDWLACLYGVHPGGKNVINEGHGRYGAYHIFDNTRKVAGGRTPGSAAGRRSPNPMGRVNFTYPRMHDSIGLSAEVIHNLGLIANPSQRDEAGADMIKRQTGYLGQLAANWRKAQLVGTLRDSLYIGFDGDDVFFDFEETSGVLPVVQQHARMPAGNKDQLDMLGDGDIIGTSWATASTNIPLHLGQINAAFQELCGGHLAACICGATVWNEIITNDFVADIHGSANAPFLALERDSLDPAVAQTMKNVYRARLSVYPDIIWYITDEGIDVGKPGSEAYSKIAPANTVLFIGHEPDDGIVGCYEGSEPIAEYDAAPESVKRGLSAWSVKRSNPTSTDLFVLDNALIVNHVPASEAFATVVF